MWYTEFTPRKKEPGTRKGSGKEGVECDGGRAPSSMQTSKLFQLHRENPEAAIFFSPFLGSRPFSVSAFPFLSHFLPFLIFLVHDSQITGLCQHSDINSSYQRMHFRFFFNAINYRSFVSIKEKLDEKFSRHLKILEAIFTYSLYFRVIRHIIWEDCFCEISKCLWNFFYPIFL